MCDNSILYPEIELQEGPTELSIKIEHPVQPLLIGNEVNAPRLLDFLHFWVNGEINIPVRQITPKDRIPLLERRLCFPPTIEDEVLNLDNQKIRKICDYDRKVNHKKVEIGGIRVFGQTIKSSVYELIRNSPNFHHQYLNLQIYIKNYYFNLERQSTEFCKSCAYTLPPYRVYYLPKTKSLSKCCVHVCRCKQFKHKQWRRQDDYKGHSLALTFRYPTLLTPALNVCNHRRGTFKNGFARTQKIESAMEWKCFKHPIDKSPICLFCKNHTIHNLVYSPALVLTDKGMLFQESSSSPVQLMENDKSSSGSDISIIYEMSSVTPHLTTPSMI